MGKKESKLLKQTLRSNFEGKMTPMDAKPAMPRRGSIIAAEHLLKRRGSRVPKHDISSLEHDAFDRTRQEHHPRRASVVHRLGKIKEIKDRINKVMTDYETRPDLEESDELSMLQEIEDGLIHVEDDLMRINISKLIAKFKKMKRYFEQSTLQNVDVEKEERTNEALQSLQDWLEADHFEDMDDEPQPPSLLIKDKDVVKGELLQVMERVEKLNELKHRIRDLKNRGRDTYHLERQKQHLQSQMKEEVKHLQETSQKDTAPPSNEREFQYIKNAATEIYDLLQRTKIEGMAQANQFEDQLNKILKEMEVKKQEITSLQKLTESQKKIILKWSVDYERLHNEFTMTCDERNAARNQNKKLTKDIELQKHMVANLAAKLTESNTISKKEHDETVQELDNNLQSYKQKMIVLKSTLQEKETKLTEVNQQINRLKQSLRRQSSISFSSETSLKSGSTESSYRMLSHRSTIGREESKCILSPFESRLDTASEDLVASLQNEIRNLKHKLQRATNEKNDKNIGDTNQSGEHVIIARKRPRLRSQSTQTSTQSVIAPPAEKTFKEDASTGDAPPPVVSIVFVDIACQTSAPATLSYANALEREDLFKAAEVMAEKFGPDWTDIASKLSTLEQADVFELDRGLALESDIFRIYSGSPTKMSRGQETVQSFHSPDRMGPRAETALTSVLSDRSSYRTETAPTFEFPDKTSHQEDEKEALISGSPDQLAHDSEIPPTSDSTSKISGKTEIVPITPSPGQISRTRGTTTMSTSSTSVSRRPETSIPSALDGNVSAEAEVQYLDAPASNVQYTLLSDKLTELAGDMLQGKDPNNLRGSNMASLHAINSQVRRLTSRVTNYVKDMKVALNTQAGLMNETNEHIKENLTEEAMRHLQSETDVTGRDVGCVEHSEEWQKMSSLQQANCKMKYIMSTICNLVKETNNIYSDEIDKQFQNYEVIRDVADKNKVPVFERSKESIENALKAIKDKVDVSNSKAEDEKEETLPADRYMGQPYFRFLLPHYAYDNPLQNVRRRGKVKSVEQWHYAPKMESDKVQDKILEKLSHHRIHTQDTIQEEEAKLRLPLEAEVITTSKNKQLGTRIKPRGLGLLIKSAVNKEESEPKQRHLMTISKNQQVFSRGDMRRHHADRRTTKFNLFDIKSRLNDPRFQSLVRGQGAHIQRPVTFGIERMKTIPVSAPKKNRHRNFEGMSPKINHLGLLDHVTFPRLH